MQGNYNETNSARSVNRGEETLWQTLAGCAAFWAGLLVLCWML